jgi:hypothetical protein
MTLDYIREFSSISKKAIKLDFLSKYLPEGDEIFVNPTTGFVTSSRKMSAEDVAAYWSNVIFPDKSIESYSANFPFAKASSPRFFFFSMLLTNLWPALHPLCSGSSFSPSR